MRVIISVLVGLSLIVGGCNERKAEADLQNQNKELTAQLAAKDQFIDEMTSSMSQIHDRLEAVVAAEKKVLRQTLRTEGKETMTAAEIKEAALGRIEDIRSMLAKDRTRLSGLQARLDESATKYKGLQKMVDDLKTQLEERVNSITGLQARVQSLEGEVSQKAQIIAARDATIEDQQGALNTVYYMIGSEKDLKGKGIIEDEGGFPWGLFGSTTVLSSKFDEDQFVTLDRTKQSTIVIPGSIEEMVPHRDRNSYETETQSDGQTALRILKPGDFWRQSHLVIVSRKPAS